ncbi:MAG: ABC transporter permease [Dehalococcoidia bacterium]
MQAYIIRRVLSYIPVVFIVSIIAFGLLRLIPGDALMAQLQGARGLSPEDLAKARQQLGLDRPLLVQYVSWIGNGLRGDWGTSFWLHKPVTAVIAQTFPVSLQLGLMAFVITTVVAVPLGIISAVKQDTWMDYVSRLFAISFLSIPSFFLATLTIVYMAKWFQWIPPRGYINFFGDPVNNLKQMIFPAIIVGLTFSASTTRMVRTTMLEILREDYIRTARAKGLREQGVILRHALRNALIPVITYWGVSLAALITGSVLIEVVFGLNGMGRLIVDAIAQRDWPVVQTVILFIVLVTLTINLVIDLLYGVMDPRISLK